MDTIFEYLSVYLFSTFKFILGPMLGVTANLNLHMTVLFSALGMTTTAVLFSFFSEYISGLTRRFVSKKKKKVFTSRNRRFVKVWSQYGVAGVAFLTPLVLSPIVGAILVNAFGGDKRKIISYMAISAVFWGYALTLILKYFKHLIF